MAVTVAAHVVVAAWLAMLAALIGSRSACMPCKTLAVVAKQPMQGCQSSQIAAGTLCLQHQVPVREVALLARYALFSQKDGAC